MAFNILLQITKKNSLWRYENYLFKTIACNKKVNYYGAMIINDEALRHNRPV
jgi:hypothetical protein